MTSHTITVTLFYIFIHILLHIKHINSGGYYRVLKYRGTVLRLILGSLKVFFASIATCFCFSHRLQLQSSFLI